MSVNLQENIKEIIDRETGMEQQRCPKTIEYISPGHDMTMAKDV